MAGRAGGAAHQLPPGTGRSWLEDIRPARPGRTARAEIAAYEEDERCRATRPLAAPMPDMPAHRSWSAMWVAAFVLAFYVWLGPYDPARTLLRRAAADPRAMLAQGEWWRAITALAIHGDEAHLGIAWRPCCFSAEEYAGFSAAAWAGP